MVERRKEQGMVVRANAVRRLGIIERLALAHIAGEALAAAPGTQDLHLDASS